jgi:hypothetical protein
MRINQKVSTIHLLKLTQQEYVTQQCIIFQCNSLVFQYMWSGVCTSVGMLLEKRVSCCWPARYTLHLSAYGCWQNSGVLKNL